MSQAQVQQHVERAVAALARNDLPAAADEFGHAIYLAPRDVVLRQRLGDLLARMGRIDAAVRQFQQVAGHYAAEGQLLKAIAICRVILEMDPGHSETQDTLAELFALQHETAPFHPRLPATMSAAVRPGRLAEPRDALEETDLDATQPLAPLDLAVQGLFDQGPAGVAGPVPPAPEAAEEAVLDTDALGRAPLFSRLHRDAFLAVLKSMELRWVKAGETVVEEGEPGDSMFVVVQGVMNVVRGKAAEGVSKPIALLGEGAFFGEMALVAGSPRLATVIAATAGLLFELDADALAEVSSLHPTVREVVHEFYRERLLANLLSSSALFRPFDTERKRELASRFTLHSLPKGTLILEQGKPGAGLCVLLRGRCEVFHRAHDGSERPYPPLREGDVFGEISLLMSSPCTANVRAATACEVLELPADAFNELVLPDPAVRRMIDRMARERLQRTADLLAATGEAELPSSWLV